MDIYTSFASVYDSFMEEVPYEKWVQFIEQVWKKYNLKAELVLDLGCGTGTVTEILAKKGYDMIGVDISGEMLSVARQKAIEKGLDILYLNQDMREFELYGTVDSCICLCDSLNYILEEDEILQVFKLVKNYLNPGGTFIFDINTEYKFKEILSENVFAETGEDAAYIWENYFDEDQRINEYYINFFTKNDSNPNLGLYERFEEVHYQRAYSIQVLKKLLEETGFELLSINDEECFGEVSETSQKLFITARG